MNLTLMGRPVLRHFEGIRMPDRMARRPGRKAKVKRGKRNETVSDPTRMANLVVGAILKYTKHPLQRKSAYSLYLFHSYIVLIPVCRNVLLSLSLSPFFDGIASSLAPIKEDKELGP